MYENSDKEDHSREQIPKPFFFSSFIYYYFFLTWQKKKRKKNAIATGEQYKTHKWRRLGRNSPSIIISVFWNVSQSVNLQSLKFDSWEISLDKLSVFHLPVKKTYMLASQISINYVHITERLSLKHTISVKSCGRLLTMI